ncbi:endo-beta-N-acetylglucosaminidase [Spiroplasma endosymbiont of Cantharis nigra]|uniref:endo-beta-N-acetylglucosaminidase n=1 Tax=Spiroplasma endosymbiont of Cantharis nigra TaxID=3066278 RepID=UPI0030CFD004
MKKLVSFLLAGSLVISSTISIISCSIGNVDSNKFLSNLSDFNWADSEVGDGIIFNNYFQSIEENATGPTIKEVKPKLQGSYINYNKFNTGFQWNQNINKQAVTGVPLNKGFMPNGNYASDFGIESKAQAFRRLNSILDWDSSKDKDAKFNVSNSNITERVFVPTKISENQDERLKYNALGFSTRKHRTFDNTIVGTKNPFENSTTNWQYVNQFINWSGSWFEGPIIPPPADTVEFAHKNGSEVYGNIFLDGYHGLTREMLRDFIQKDKSGRYKIVDILIDIAAYMGFDGWFINNEANGQLPNGTILNYNEMFEIIKQFQETVAKSNDDKINKLELFYYRNDATLKENNGIYVDKEMVKMAQANYLMGENQKKIKMQVNFGELPENSQYFLKQHQEYNSEDVFTLIDQGANSFYYGSLDFKDLAYKYSQSEQKFDKDIYSSFATYLDNGSGIFANEAYNYIKTIPNTDKLRNYLFANQVGNLFNDIQFSGTNLFVSKNNKGLSKNLLSNNLKQSNYDKNAIIADPRIKFKNKNKLEKKLKENEDTKKIYDFVYDYSKNSSSINSNSFGVGDLIPEKTIITDNYLNQRNFKTNFSTGNGIKFKNENYTVENYPWTNRRLADVLPTYRWRIYDSQNSNQALPINKFYGGFDYDEVYNKGNSIAIGSGFDEEGRILSTEWDTKNYEWDILGTDFLSNDKEIKVVYKVDNLDDIDINLNLTGINKNSKISKKIKVDNLLSRTYLTNDWVELKVNLNDLNLSSEFETISKVGLSINPNKKSIFKINVGEIQINNIMNINSEKNNSSQEVDLDVEYAIKRDNSDTYNIRFSWNYLKDNDFDYFDILVYYEKKWYRVGETTSTNYFLRDLKAKNNKVLLSIRPRNKNQSIEGEEYKFNINL